jgi:hypothetical protein
MNKLNTDDACVRWVISNTDKPAHKHAKKLRKIIFKEVQYEYNIISSKLQ